MEIDCYYGMQTELGQDPVGWGDYWRGYVNGREKAWKRRLFLCVILLSEEKQIFQVFKSVLNYI